MAIVDFQQDVSQPFGTGNFRDDQGRTMYLTDPDTAQQFVKTMPGQSSLASQVGAESTAIANTAVPSAAQALVDKHLSALASNAGATGSAAIGASPAQALVDKHNAAVTPALPAPRADGLVKTGTSYSRQTQQGRNVANVNAQIGAEETAGAAGDKAIQDSANAADNRAMGVINERQQGVQAGAGRDVVQGFEAKRIQQEAQAQVGQLREELKQNDEAYDPDRLMKNMSTGKSVLMVVLAAISGAFGAVLGNKDNAFMSVIDRKVAQDIDKQKAEIASGRIRIGNQISELMQKGYDAKTAEKLATDRLNAGVDKMIELQAQRQGLQGAQLDAAKGLIAQRQEARAARRGDLLAQTESRVAESSGTTYERPKPTALSVEDIYKQGQIHQQQLEELDANEIAKVIGKPDADGKVRPVSVKRAAKAVEDAQKLATELPRGEVAQQQLRNVLVAAGVPADAYNSDTGTIDWTKAPSDLKGVGALDSRPGLKNLITEGPIAGAISTVADASGAGYTDNQKVKDSAATLRESVTYFTTGAVADKQIQVPVFQRQAGEDTQNEESFKKNISELAQQIATHRSSLMSGNADGARLYVHNKGKGDISSLQPGFN